MGMTIDRSKLILGGFCLFKLLESLCVLALTRLLWSSSVAEEPQRRSFGIGGYRSLFSHAELSILVSIDWRS